MAQVTVQRDTDVVIIERKHLVSRKERNQLDDNGDAGNVVIDTDCSTGYCTKRNEASYWKERFEKLNTEKKKEDFSRLDDILERYETLRQYTQLLEERALRHANEKKEAEGLFNKVKFYEQMTAMKVDQSSTGEYICTLKNSVHRRVTKFSIKRKRDSRDGLDMQFIPRANVNILPDYLQSEIFCETNMSPVIMGDVLQALYNDEDHGDGSSDDPAAATEQD